LYASLCSNADKKDDPIDRAVLNAMKNSSASSDGYIQNELIGFNNIAKRVCAFVTTPSGSTLTIAKGMGAKIIDTTSGGIDDCELQWTVAQARDKSFAANLAREENEIAVSGYKTIAIAVCKGNARELGDAAIWNFAGLLAMLDPPRHDTPATIESLHRANISVKMITGESYNHSMQVLLIES
jgi:H+-transporting ATPase